MTTIPQNTELLKNLFNLIATQGEIAEQQRVRERLEMLLLSELFTFGRHTITQMLMSLGLNDQDWSAWYRLFSEERFNYEAACEGLFKESLEYVAGDEVYVVAGDATQTPRSSRKMEGAGWLRNMRTPPFMVGIHAAQRWFNGSWLVPEANGYSRAIPLRWMPAFTEKSQPQTVEPLKEWQASVQFLTWLKQQFIAHGRPEQAILFVGDGHYDHLKLWQQLPAGVTMLARSAKNRVLYELPDETLHGNRKYGKRAPTPQSIWRHNKHWRKRKLSVRGKQRHLEVCVRGPFRRRGAPGCPLFLIVVRGKKRKNKYGRLYRRHRCLSWSMRYRIQREGGSCLSHWTRCFCGPGSAGKWKSLTANSKPPSVWVTNNASIPKRLFCPFSGVSGSTRFCFWQATARLDWPVLPMSPLVGGAGQVVGLLPLCCALTVRLCGDSTIFDLSLPQHLMIGSENAPM